jgi:hypothetical protein
MKKSQPLTIFLAATILMSTGRAVLSQPFLREGDADTDEQAEPSDEQRRDAARRRADLQFQEEQRMKQQEELMRLQGERLLAEREEIERSQRMMRYALIIALVVIGTTLLIAFARSRTADDGTKE